MNVRGPGARRRSASPARRIGGLLDRQRATRCVAGGSGGGASEEHPGRRRRRRVRTNCLRRPRADVPSTSRSGTARPVALDPAQLRHRPALRRAARHRAARCCRREPVDLADGARQRDLAGRRQQPGAARARALHDAVERAQRQRRRGDGHPRAREQRSASASGSRRSFTGSESATRVAGEHRRGASALRAPGDLARDDDRAGPPTGSRAAAPSLGKDTHLRRPRWQLLRRRLADRGCSAPTDLRRRCGARARGRLEPGGSRLARSSSSSATVVRSRTFHGRGVVATAATLPLRARARLDRHGARARTPCRRQRHRTPPARRSASSSSPRRVLTPVLDATAARPARSTERYEFPRRLGDAPGWRLRAAAAAGAARAGGRGARGRRRATSTLIAALDRRAFGYERGACSRGCSSASPPPSPALALRAAASRADYPARRDGREAAADRPARRRPTRRPPAALIAHAARARRDAGVPRCSLDRHQDLRGWLAVHGFAPQRRFTRMLYRRDEPAGDARLAFAIAGPELG